jgi:uncharacterized protein (TIGR00266 family)
MKSFFIISFSRCEVYPEVSARRAEVITAARQSTPAIAMIVLMVVERIAGSARMISPQIISEDTRFPICGTSIACLPCQIARVIPSPAECIMIPMRYEITGDNLQMVTVRLAPGESIYAEAGAMVNMSGNMEMQTTAKGGLFSGLKRMVAGESFFMTEFSSNGSEGFVSFAGTVPGKIFPVALNGGEFIAQKDSLLCAEPGIDLDIAFTKKIRSGIFGGEGFILERLSGTGTAFLHCCGDIMEMNLQPGEVVKVETGLVVGFDSNVTYSIALAGGVRTVLFGGEGLFLTTLTGPGKVVLQSMDIAKLAGSLIPFLPQPKSGK